MPRNNNTVKIDRSAKTGQFVSKKFAHTHPSTTVSETVKHSPHRPLNKGTTRGPIISRKR